MPDTTRHPNRARRRALLAGVVALGLTGVGVAPALAAPPAPPAQPPASSGDGSGGERHDVTLITGDVVHVSELAGGATDISVDTATPGAGWQQLRNGDDVVVIPQGVERYLAAGTLDQDLFNVTKLIEDGYDDASVDATPIIVEHSGKPRVGTFAPGIGAGKELPSVSAAATTSKKSDAARTWRALTSVQTMSAKPGALSSGIEAIHLDGKVEATLDSSVPWIGADTAWDAGYTGDGVTVAVLDSGIDTTHPDLAGRVLPNSQSFVPGEEFDDDANGHGTHVASTIAGSGAASDGKNRGVADGADLLVGKVLGDDGYGQESWIISAMEWASQNAPIVSMSLGTPSPSDGTDMMSQAVDHLTEENGTLFVIAAGNEGVPESVGSPGAAKSALTVGSVDDPSGELSWFSSQGPVWRSGGLKPDIAGPGNNVTAARSAQSPGSGSYISLRGTSMATPHVAGAAAILKQQHPEFTGAQLRAAITSTARDVDLTSYQAGSGVVDVARLISTEVVASGSGDFGVLPWGDEAEPQTRTVEFTNGGDAEVTVALEAQLTDSTEDGGGRDASGILTLDTDELVIPAGETRAVTLSADPAAVPAASQFTGALVGSIDGAAVTRTSLGIGAEAERYDLNITATGLDGEPAETYAFVTSTYPEPTMGAVLVPGDVTLRLPAGRYAVMSMMTVFPEPDAEGIAMVGDPDIVLDGSRDVALDARTAKKASFDVGENNLEAPYLRMDYTADGISGSAMASAWVDDVYAQPQQVPDAESFTFVARARLQKPKLDVSIGGTRLDVLPQFGAADLDGNLKAKGVDVGTGTVEEFAAASVKGLVAVAKLTAGANPAQIAANASKSGAKLLVLISPDDREFSAWVGGKDVTIPVAGISGIDGESVLKGLAGHQQFVAVGTPVPNEVFDVANFGDREIPKDLTGYAPDLARVDTRIFGTKGEFANEFRTDMVPGATGGISRQMPIARGADRVDWVSTGPVRWAQNLSTGDYDWDMRDTMRTYEKGDQKRTSYFGPVVHPYVNTGYWAPYRSSSLLVFNVPAHGDSGDAGHTGSVAGGTYTGRLFVDGTKIADTRGQAPQVRVPVEQSRVRYEISTTHDGSVLPTGTATETAWEFTTDGTTGVKGYLPMLQAHLSLDLDADGRVGATRTKGSTVPITVELGHLSGAIGSAAVKGAALEMRVPGGEWQQAALKTESIGTDGPGEYNGLFAKKRAFVASFSGNLPVTDQGGYIDLRVTGEDEAGNSISQQIVKAVEIAPARGAR